MNEDTSTTINTDTDTGSPTPAASNRALGMWIVLVIVIALLAGAGFYGWKTLQSYQSTLQLEATQKIDELKTQLTALRADQRAATQRTQDAATTNRILRDEILGLSQRSALLEATVAKFSDPTASPIVQALRLDEVELLLSQAQQRLSLAGDLAGARRAYALANSLLEQMDDPAYFNLRQALEQERTALLTIELSPQAAALIQLDELTTELTKLPAEIPATPLAERPLWQRILAPLVEIRPASKESLIDNSQRNAAHDALQLEITLARAAIERADAENYRATLSRIHNWVDRLWPNTPERQACQETLKTLGNTSLHIELPELGSTLLQLQAMQTARTAP